MSTVFELPALGENVDAADILKVLVSEGDEITEDQAVLEVESDKATVEVPCSVAGTVSQIFVTEGDSVQVGDRVLEVEGDEGGAAEGDQDAPDDDGGAPAEDEDAAQAARDDTGSDDDDAPDEDAGEGRRPIFAAPSVRRVARERGVDLTAVKGAGPEGRITVEDVEAHADAGAEEAKRPAPSPPPEGRTEELRGPRKTIARRMAEAWRTIPHVTLHARPSARGLTEALEQFRELAGEDGPRVTLTAVLLKLTAAALRRHPRLNAHFDEDGLTTTRFDAVHLGVAVDTESGLLVPVVRDADRRSVREIAEVLADLSEQARAGALKGEQMKGATFTVSNLGGLGVEAFTPIITPPQVGVLGVGAATARGDDATSLSLSLSFDHRALDGADAARFLQTLGALTADARRLAFET